jgi:hypothetical protein
MPNLRTCGVLRLDTRAVTSRRAVAVLAAAALALAGCTSEKDPGPEQPTPQESPAPEGGTADEPVPLAATKALLVWRPAPGAVDNTVTTNGTWFLTVESSGQAYRLDGPDQSFGTGEADTRITNALLDSDWAVVVRQDDQGTRPSTAEVTDLAKGEQFTIDQASDVPTVDGGTWSLAGDQLVHATAGPGGTFCVATVDLDSRTSAVAWCAAAKHGFKAAHVTDAGTTVLSFDDAKPSCRTVGSVADNRFDPFPGVPECVAWEGALLDDDSAVWSVIPNEADMDVAEFFARAGDGYFDLGPGASGTLVPCAGAAYFVRDPQRDDDSARLMRWDGRSLTTVYAAAPGPTFLDAPRCGDSALVLTAHAEAGDQQVMAALG